MNFHGKDIKIFTGSSNVNVAKGIAGRAKEQTEDFLAELVQPVLDKYADIESDKPEINV